MALDQAHVLFNMVHNYATISIYHGLLLKDTLSYAGETGTYESMESFYFELDCKAIEYWHTRYPNDCWKNNYLGQPVRNHYSFVARMMKQGGAQELYGVGSPYFATWTAKDLKKYCQELEKAEDLKNVPDSASVANRDRAQR